MRSWEAKLASYLSAACVLFGGPALADTGACDGLTKQQAFTTLSHARALLSDPVMYELEGDMPRLLQSYRCLATSPSAQTDLESLLAKGNISGQLFALAALWDTNPKSFPALAAPFRQRQDQVFIVYRDVVRGADAKTVVTWIEAGAFSELLRGYVALPEKQGAVRRREP